LALCFFYRELKDKKKSICNFIYSSSLRPEGVSLLISIFFLLFSGFNFIPSFGDLFRNYLEAMGIQMDFLLK